MKIQRIVRHVFLERYGVKAWITGNEAARPSMVIVTTATVPVLNIIGLSLSISRSKIRNIHYVPEYWSKRSTKGSYPSAFISQFKLFRWLLVGSRYQQFARHWPISLRSVSVHYINTSHEAQTKSYQISRKASQAIIETVKNSGTSLCWCV
jgi:hypothetical protein